MADKEHLDLQELDAEIQPITDSLKENYMPYAMSVIVSRALPEIDGFKPSHRKLLYTMYRMGLMKGSRAKSADIVGQTMALHPHGDQAIYETMVRMTRGNGALLYPWIDSKGNFGRVFSRDMQYAAYRYTEAKLDKICELVFEGIDKDAVDFVDNYSGSFQEPVLLPVQVPTILMNNTQGIAVGMASNICSFNLGELTDATLLLIDNPEATSEEILEIMPAPDFPTGGRLVYEPEKMAKIYETGRGSFHLRARHRVIAKKRLIEVFEIPYTTTIEAIIDDITDGVKKGKLKEITDVRDETDLGGLKIAIEYKTSADPDFLIQKLYKMTSLESSFSANFNVLIDYRPQVLGVRGILNAWLDWREATVKRQRTFELNKLKDQLHLLNALEQILLDIDEAIKIIRKTEKEKDVIPRLMEHFKIDERQAEYVAEIRLRQLNREYLLRRITDIADLKERITKLERMVKSSKLLRKEIARELKAAKKKYAEARRTELVDPEIVPTLSKEDLITDYNVKYFLTREGYFKKLALTSLRSAGDLKLKEGDAIIREIEGVNKSEIVFFTNKAQVYKTFGYEIEDHKPSDFGEFLEHMLELEEGEEVLAFHVFDEEEFPGYFMLAFGDGRAVKFPCSEYETKTKRKRLVNAFYGKAPLVAVYHIDEPEGNGDYFMENSQKRLILFDTDMIPLMATRTARGTRIMSQRKGYELVAMYPAEDLEIPDEEREYYRIRTIPAAGRFIKEELIEERQLSFDSVEMDKNA